MDKWATILAALGGFTGFGTLLAFFIVPASKRNEETNARIAKLERKTARLTRSDAKMRAVIILLIQRDDAMVLRLKSYEPDAVIESIQDLLERLNLSMHTIIGIDDEGEEEEKDG